MSNIIKRNAKTAGLLAIAVSCFAGEVSAGLMNNFYGNTILYSRNDQMGEGYVLEMNFAVYDRSLGTAGDPYGTGINMVDASDQNGLRFNPGLSSSTFQTTDNFLYLYQLGYDGPIGINPTLEIPTKFAASWGTLTGQNGHYTSFFNPSAQLGTEKARIFQGEGAQLVTVGAPSGAGQADIAQIAHDYNTVNVNSHLSPNVFTNIFGFTSSESPVITTSSFSEGKKGILRGDFLDLDPNITNGIVLVSGFPANPIPEPLTIFLLSVGMAALKYGKRSKRLC